MSQATQCQKPLPVGASASNSWIAKLRVPAGAPDQLSCGETPASGQPQNGAGIGRPARMSVLVSLKCLMPVGRPARTLW